MQDEKPPYSIPSMGDIAAVPWNGFYVASTFSGCGGSCLGYRMAGYRVVWANEFVRAAQATYRANHPNSFLDPRDIRLIHPAEILAQIGLQAGDLDVLDGSPPCDSFSTVGKREKTWGKAKSYHGHIQRTDDLFFEYIRLLQGLQPKVFIAENVSGLIKGTAKGYFKLILAALKACGYRVEARLLDAQWLGVPQVRQRIIFQGVRMDLARTPAWPRPLPYRYSLREALPWMVQMASNRSFQQTWHNAQMRPSVTITAQRHARFHSIEAETDISSYALGLEWEKLQVGEQSATYYKFRKPHLDNPFPMVTTRAASVVHPFEKRQFSIAELKRICAFPEDFVLTGTYAEQWERLGLSVPPLMMAAIATAIRNGVLCSY